MPYGLPGRYGSPIPHSGMRYDYGVPASAHGPYGPMPTFPPGGYGGTFSLVIFKIIQNKLTFGTCRNMKVEEGLNCQWKDKEMVGNIWHRCNL